MICIHGINIKYCSICQERIKEEKRCKALKLLKRAADRLIELTNGDYNDSLATEIEEYLKTVK